MFHAIASDTNYTWSGFASVARGFGRSFWLPGRRGGSRVNVAGEHVAVYRSAADSEPRKVEGAGVVQP